MGWPFPMRRSASHQVAVPKFALLAAASVMFSLILLAACGGGGGEFPLSGGNGSDGSRVSAGGVTLTLPAGWAFLDSGDRGLVLAEHDGDLTAAVPQGPRLTVEPGSTASPDPEAMVSAMVGSGAGAPAAWVDVVEEPETVPVGAEVGVSIGLLENEDGGAVIKRYVIVNVDGIHVHQFVLEAPEDQWNGSADTLESVMGSAVFEPPVAAEGPRDATDEPAEVPAGWRVVLHDTFDSNVNGWSTSEASGGSVTRSSRELAGGEYSISLESQRSAAIPAVAKTVEIDSDFHVAVDAFRREGSGELLCGLSLLGETGYPRLQFIVQDVDGQFRVIGGDTSGAAQQSVVSLTTSPAIRSEAVNRLAVLAQGSHLTLYINGQRVGEADDDRVTSVRFVGVAANTPSGGGGGTCEFDNLEVWAP